MRVWMKTGTFALASVLFAGCENPADDVSPAVTGAPAPAAPAPAPANPSAPAQAAPSLTNQPGAPAATAVAPASAMPTAPAGALAISGETSKIDFVGSKPTGKHDGGFKSFSGFAEVAGSELTRIAVEIDMNSIWSDDQKLTGHLKNKDFFEVDTYKTSTFVTTAIKAGGEKGATHAITGNLTLHGVTKSITFPATVEIKDGSLSLKSEFFIKKTDFGMMYGSSGIIRDEVVLKLDVKASKKS